MKTVGERTKRQKDSEINVDLWPPGAWTQKELHRFVDIVGEFGPTSGQISSGMRGIEVQIFIGFLASAIAVGFFARLGSDLYEFSRTRLKRLLLKQSPDAGKTVQCPRIKGRLTFRYCEPQMDFSRVYYVCLYSTGFDLDTFFSSLSRMDTLVRGRRCSRSFPFDKGQSYDVYAELEISPQPSWNVRVRRYTEENGHLILNEFFRAHFEVKELEGLKWEEVQWIRA